MAESKPKGQRGASRGNLDRWGTSPSRALEAVPVATDAPPQPAAPTPAPTPATDTGRAADTYTPAPARGVKAGARRQTLDLPGEDYRWLHDLAAELADEQGVRRRDLSAQHVLRAAVMLMRPGTDGDPWADFRVAVREQAQAEARAVEAADREAREAARKARDNARRTVPRTT